MQIGSVFSHVFPTQKQTTQQFQRKGCHVYQYMAIIAQKCLLSMSPSETSLLRGVNINKVLLSWVLQHSNLSGDISLSGRDSLTKLIFLKYNA